MIVLNAIKFYRDMGWEMHKNSDVLALGRFAAFALLGVLFVGLFSTVCYTNTVVSSVSIYSDGDAALIVSSTTLPSTMALDVGTWVKVSTSPNLGDYAVAVTSAGENIYIANSSTAQVNYFMRYNTITRSWSSTSNTPQWFKNGTAMAWDQDKYIYVFMGASYSDTSHGGRFYFYRYNIATSTWTQLRDTPKTNGAGDALCFVPGWVLGVSDDNFLYAILGNADVGSNFYRYSIKTNTWSAALNFPWSATDDGCSLVWTGDNYLYALRGEYIETTPCYDFARYHLLNGTWENRAPIPAYPHDSLNGTPGAGGVGDGGSLVWVGGARSNYIYALSGNQCYPEPIWDNRFYLYTISTDSWERLADLPAGVGDQNGQRLAFVNENIYCWRGCNKDGSLYAYSVDTLAPAAPGLLAPINGTITNDNTPTFEWTSVSDPSGVTYQIQIDDNDDFSSPVYSEINLTGTTFTLLDEYALASGKYYWHVRAKDGANNVGDWSEEWNFTVVPVGAVGMLLMPLLMLLPFALMLRRQNRRYRY
jgi:hypothetical protein